MKLSTRHILIIDSLVDLEYKTVSIKCLAREFQKRKKMTVWKSVLNIQTMAIIM